MEDKTSFTSPDGRYTVYGAISSYEYSDWSTFNFYFIDNSSGKKTTFEEGSRKYGGIDIGSFRFSADNNWIFYSESYIDSLQDRRVTYTVINLVDGRKSSIGGGYSPETSAVMSYDSAMIEFYESDYDSRTGTYGPNMISKYYYFDTIPQLSVPHLTIEGPGNSKGFAAAGDIIFISIDSISVADIYQPEEIELKLSNGGIAKYDSLMSSTMSSLIFKYQVDLDSYTKKLQVSSIDINGAKLVGIGGAEVITSHVKLEIPGSFEINGYYGTNSDETFSGTIGAERFQGNAGNDTYTVNNAGDTVLELKGQGNDKVIASISYALLSGQEIERLELSPASAKVNLNLTGNEFDQTLTGNVGANRLDGGGGADTLYGYAGDDIYVVDTAKDQVFEARGQGNDAVLARVSYTLAAGQEIERLYADDTVGTKALDLEGNAFAQTLRGNAGKNVLNGAGGIDTAIGGKGDDTYRVDDARDVVIERANEGNDTLVATASYALAAGQSIETLRLAGLTGKANLNLSGNEVAQSIYGNAGNNTLDGKGGVDKLYGGLGNDIYGVDNAKDQVFETRSQGTDTVVAFTTYVLASGQEIERMQLAGATGTKNFNLTGNEFAQALYGNAGSNLLDGKGGADQLFGGSGNDTYVVENTFDRVFEARGQGKDSVIAFTSHALSSGQEIESLKLAPATQFKNFDLTGNEYGQVITGNAGNNVLDGKGGLDMLHGGKGQDSFVFSVAPSTSNVDHLADFAPVDDSIRLTKGVFSALAAGPLADRAFKDVGDAGAKVDADDHIIYDHRNGALYYDTNGSGVGGRTLVAVLDNKALLTHDDFFVV